MSYPIGSVVSASVIFERATDSTAVDPTAVSCTIVAPNRRSTLYVYGVDVALVRDAPGAFHVWISVDMPGTWGITWTGTGINAAVVKRYFAAW